MNVPKLGNYDARALPQLAWQVSAVPAQLLGLHGAERRGLPFLAAVTGTAALGVVDWPVALLIAGGYLLTSRPPGQSPLADTLSAPAATLAAAPPDAAASGRTPAAPPLADPKQAAAQPALARLSAAEPEPSSSTADAGPPTATPAASPPRQPGRSAPTPVSIEQTSPQAAATPAAAVRPEQPPAPAIARQQRQSRPSRDTRRSPSPSAATREPWPGYDQMTVPRVLARLDDPDVDLAAVERYEKAHRDRKMVHAAIAGRRASRQS